ncbi:MAG TPA: polysaccharide deacetylase family protein [Candidatus Latescibacteria bacterium]|nr:polysaccharide deacetylase family protein [Candidatus Latescibacterota bacterium]
MDEAVSAALRANGYLWDLYTRREEYEPIFLDGLGRFRFFASQQRAPFDPVVSRFLFETGAFPAFPAGRRYAICLSHDIDALHLNRYRSGGAGLLSRARRASARSAELLLSRSLKRGDPGWNLERIADIEKERGAKSAFYSLALEEGEKDFYFRVQEIGAQLRTLVARGWEAGLHGGHEAYCDPTALRREKARLEAELGTPVTGFRAHYLRFDVPGTWRLLAEAGFRYDTTFGYADCVGFRNGMCHPYTPFDRNADRFIPILEVPLAVMDTTLQLYMRLDPADAWTVIRRLLDAVAECSGVLTVLWHPQNMNGAWGDLYLRILDYGTDTDAWLTGPGELAGWWLSQQAGGNA